MLMSPRITLLSAVDNDDLTSFDCGDSLINKFFRTFAAKPSEDQLAFVGYDWSFSPGIHFMFALRKIRESIRGQETKAVEITYIAKDKNSPSKGVHKEILAIAIQQALAWDPLLQAVVIQAKHEWQYRLYEKFGFIGVSYPRLGISRAELERYY
jgi:hypothetical protein